jgi:tetratricopeptide (TPR) repeat protein
MGEVRPEVPMENGMSDCPNLVFVKGPQAPQRVALNGEAIIAGRSPDCQLRLKEHYVSREQMQFTRTADGWVMENLSSNGTLVNGRRYKAGTQIILATGDLLGVGMETEILFVAAGDDPKEALAKYREAIQQAAPPPPVEAPLPAETSALAEPPNQDLPPPPEDEPEPAAESVGEMTEEQIRQQKQKAKMKKYLVLGCISVAVTVGLIALGSLSGPKPPPHLDGGPPRLTDTEIRDAITKLPELSLDPTQAAVHLEKATEYFQNHFQLGKSYLCVKHYKRYLAYRGSSYFPVPVDQQRYQAMLDGDGQGETGLVPAICGDYNRACDYEQAQRWPDAMPLFEKLVAMIPEDDSTEPTYERLLQNIIEHRNFVQLKIAKK